MQHFQVFSQENPKNHNGYGTINSLIAKFITPVKTQCNHPHKLYQVVTSFDFPLVNLHTREEISQGVSSFSDFLSLHPVYKHLSLSIYLSQAFSLCRDFNQCFQILTPRPQFSLALSKTTPIHHNKTKIQVPQIKSSQLFPRESKNMALISTITEDSSVIIYCLLLCSSMNKIAYDIQVFFSKRDTKSSTRSETHDCIKPRNVTKRIKPIHEMAWD